MKPYGWRDQVFVTLANAILWFASERYSLTLKYIIKRGMQAIDEERGR